MTLRHIAQGRNGPWGLAARKRKRRKKKHQRLSLRVPGVLRGDIAFAPDSPAKIWQRPAAADQDIFVRPSDRWRVVVRQRLPPFFPAIAFAEKAQALAGVRLGPSRF